MLRVRCEAVDVFEGRPGFVEASIKDDRTADVLADPTIICRDLQSMIIQQGGPLVEVITVVNLEDDSVLYQHPNIPRIPAALLEDDESSPDVD